MFKPLVFAALTIAAVPTASEAAVLFDSLAGNGQASFGPKAAGTGTGQVLAFEGTIKTITSFGFIISGTAGTSFKFFINRGNTEKLFTVETVLTRDYARELFLSPEILFVIPQINQQYTFGIIGNREFAILADLGGLRTSQNGITEITGQNPNYVNYANVFYDRNGLAEINVQLNGLGGPAVPPTAVPEPAAWSLMIVGFGLMGGAFRRRSTKLSYC